MATDPKKSLTPGAVSSSAKTDIERSSQKVCKRQAATVFTLSVFFADLPSTNVAPL